MEKPILFLNNIAKAESFTTTKTPPPSPDLPQRDRIAHAERLSQQFTQVWNSLDYTRQQREAASLPNRDGCYLQVIGQSGYELVSNSLEDRRSKKTLGARLISVNQAPELPTRAIVYIPSGQERKFLKKIQEYSDTTKTTPKGNPLNQSLIESIEDIELALLENLWQDPIEDFPRETPVWCEIWLRTEEGRADEIIELTYGICQSIGIEINQERLDFPERSVIVIRSDKGQLQELFAQSDNLAEIRLAKEPVSFWSSMSNYEQTEAAGDLLSRVTYDDKGVSICILDSGINNGHRLLQKSCSDNERETYHPDWPPTDHEGHGTQMAGISVFGDLQNAIESLEPIIINHRIFSGKILPPPNFPDNNKILYGAITNQTISKCGIKMPDRNLHYCLAVTTSYETDYGRPSSWSAEIDKLAFGDENGNQRLFLISAGNAFNLLSEKEELLDYPNINCKLPIQNPAQSWNALTIGAFTEKTRICDPDYQGYVPLAQHGELSPHSTTSLSWDTKRWPNKPDIVLEGGNLVKSLNNDIDSCEDLSILTTSSRPIIKQFELFSATSSATAKASWMAAQIQCLLPNAWPETVRALMVHSADWTPQLIKQFGIDLNKKGAIGYLLRIAGYGVPDLEKASSCATNHLTLIAQESIQPFNKDGSTNEMHFYELPWPREALYELGEQLVTVTITLSYFIEPSPGELQTQNRYTYSSHGLRFDLNSPEEAVNIDSFKKRLNKEAREGEKDTPEYSGIGERWKIGPTFRSKGTVQSDSVSLSGIELADCNNIAVYPVGGWWKTRKSEKCMEKECRYSLVVSLRTDSTEVDIYTPVETTISIKV